MQRASSLTKESSKLNFFCFLTNSMAFALFSGVSPERSLIAAWMCPFPFTGSAALGAGSGVAFITLEGKVAVLGVKPASILSGVSLIFGVPTES